MTIIQETLTEAAGFIGGAMLGASVAHAAGAVAGGLLGWFLGYRTTRNRGKDGTQ